MNQAMNVTARLAEFAADLSYDGLPEDIIQRSRMFVLDAAATMMAAVTFSRDNDDRMLRAYLDVVAAQPGPSSIVGHGMSTTPMMAAFAIRFDHLRNIIAVRAGTEADIAIIKNLS